MQNAIGRTAIKERVLRDVWSARDLRYVRMNDDWTVEPLCPVALQGIVSFMSEAAVTVELDQSSIFNRRRMRF